MIYQIKYFSKRIRRFNINVSNIIAGIHEFKILTKHLQCEYKYEFDGRKCNSNQKWYNDKYYIWKNIIYEKKVIIEILLHVVSKMVNI